MNDGADLTQTRRLDFILRENLFGDDADAPNQFAAINCTIYTTTGFGDQRRKEAEDLARSIAERSKANVVTWGEVVPNNAEIALRMTHATNTAKASYCVEDSTLTKDFGEALGALIAAKMLTLVELARGDDGTYLVPRMERALTLTTPLVAALTPQMTADSRGALYDAHASALYFIGLQLGDAARLEQSVDAYTAAMQEYTQSRVPLDWAAKQNNLDVALAELGQREGDLARLLAAMDAYTAALQEWTQTRVPLDWAFTQGNLASVEIVLFDKTGDLSHLTKARAYAQAARDVFVAAEAGHYLGIADAQMAQIDALQAGRG